MGGLIGVASIGAILSLSIGWFIAIPPLMFSILAVTYAFFIIGDSPALFTALARLKKRTSAVINS